MSGQPQFHGQDAPLCPRCNPRPSSTSFFPLPHKSMDVKGSLVPASGIFVTQVDPYPHRQIWLESSPLHRPGRGDRRTATSRTSPLDDHPLNEMWLDKSYPLQDSQAVVGCGVGCGNRPAKRNSDCCSVTCFTVTRCLSLPGPPPPPSSADDPAIGTCGNPNLLSEDPPSGTCGLTLGGFPKYPDSIAIHNKH